MSNNDITEIPRKEEIQRINARIESDDAEKEQKRLQDRYGSNDVFTTEQIREKFEVIQFLAPFIIVKEKSSGKVGSLRFQNYPRFYFDFRYEDNTKPNETIKKGTIADILGLKTKDDIEQYAEQMAKRMGTLFGQKEKKEG
jgi:hypothetical protein